MAAPKTSSHELFTILSGLAQELGGPLLSMAQSTQSLIDEYKNRNFEYLSYKDFKKIVTTLEQINRQLRRCGITTGRVLALNTAADKASAGPCAVNEVIKETLELLEQQLGSARIKVSLRLAKDMPLVRLGKVECFQIIYNILMNAVQAMPAGGAIRIRTALNKAGKTVLLEVQDEGIGITPGHLSRVFEPFFTTKERGFEKNAGLGLSIVHSIIERVGGDIHIQSSLRKGTVVRIDLPPAAASRS